MPLGRATDAAAEGLRIPSHAVVNEAKATLQYSRFYHLFVEGELRQLVGTVPGARVEELYFDHSNWCVVVQKAELGGER